MSVLRIIRTGGAEDDLDLKAVYRQAKQIIDRLFDLAAQNKIRLGPSVQRDAEATVSDGLAGVFQGLAGVFPRAFPIRGKGVALSGRQVLNVSMSVG